MSYLEERVLVIAAVIRRDDCVLLCRRPAHKRHGGLWEFPGGKLEEGESLLQAAQRELEEELGLRATSVGGVLFERQDPGSVFVIQFVEVVALGEPEALEHEEIRWVSMDQAGGLPLAPTDAAFIFSLRSGERS